jgi:hypothetical protein
MRWSKCSGVFRRYWRRPARRVYVRGLDSGVPPVTGTNIVRATWAL